MSAVLTTNLDGESIV